MNDVLSTSVINGSNLTGFQREMAGSSGAPETGMFDFMNYLMGLQGQSDDLLQIGIENPLAGLIEKGGEKKGEDEALLSLFDKKGRSPLDPIALSNLFPQTQNQISNLLPIKNGTDSSAVLGLDRDTKEGFSQSAELKNVLFTLGDQNGQSLQMLQRTAENSDNISKDSVNSKTQKENALQQYLAHQGQSRADFSKSVTKNTVTPASQQGEGKSDVSLSDSLKHSELSSKHNLKTEDKSKGHYQELNSLTAFALGVDSKSQVDTSELRQGESQGPVVRATLPELFEKVQGMVQHGNGKMTVALNPPDLGQVEIHVTTRGKNVEVSMKSENDFAKSAIESSLGDLRSSMEAQELNLTKLEVHVQRDLGTQIQNDFASQWAGQDSAFQQSRGFPGDSSTESPWQESSGKNSLKTIEVSSGLGVRSSDIRSMPVGNGRVDIRI
ncbi:MAG: flagellar hook-length control protein FliK [Deltaproteobacteria bacterium]|nr:flagellar hook-length control protein FliK [Deltaproteobacteria bacterium]